ICPDEVSRYNWTFACRAEERPMDSRMTIKDRMRSHRFASTLLVVITLFLGILIGTTIQRGVKGANRNVDSSDAAQLKIPAPQQLSNAFSQVAKQLEPSVVN